nr:O-antigen ligase family protein [Curvibacter sp. CHRR-16]
MAIVYSFVHLKKTFSFSFLLIVLSSLGLGLTGSRAGMLSILVAGALVNLNSEYRKNKLIAHQLLLVILIVGSSFLPSLFLQENSMPTTRIVSGAVSDRIEIWSRAIEAIRLKWIVGYGWDGAVAALFHTAQSKHYLQLFGSAHNIFLDMFIYTGVLFGGGVIFIFLMSFFVCLRSGLKNGGGVVFLLIIPLFIHSQFEFPLHYLYFLIPFGFFLGKLSSEVSIGKLSAQNFYIGTILCMLLAAALIIGYDYLKIENSYFYLRLRNAERAIVFERSEMHPDLIVLKGYERFFDANDIDVSQTILMDSDYLDDNLVLRYPSQKLMFALIKKHALLGDLILAKKWMIFYCSSYESSVKDAKFLWDSEALAAKSGLLWNCDN